MNTILAFMHWQWEINIVEFFNQITSIEFFRLFFKFFNNFGSETVFIVLIGATYWAINKKVAKDVGIAAFYAMMFNNLFKSFFNRLRPFQQSPSTIECRDTSILSKDLNGNYIEVNGEYGTYYQSTSSSFPSGHAQGASSVYNSYAMSLKKKWVWIVASILCALVMIARMALGVHFFTDVLVGYLVGIGVSALIFYLRKKVKNELILHIVVLSTFTVLTFLSPLWSDATRDMFITLGTSVGLIGGMLFEEKKVDFKMTKNVWKAILRVVIGIAIAFVLKIGLKYLYSWAFDEGTYLANVCDMLRYMILVFIAVGVYPIFIKKWKFLNDKEEVKE